MIKENQQLQRQGQYQRQQQRQRNDTGNDNDSDNEDDFIGMINWKPYWYTGRRDGALSGLRA